MPMKILMLNALTEQSGSGVRFWSIGKELARLGHSILFLERSISKDVKKEKSGLRYHAIMETGVLWLDIFRATWLNVFYGLLFRPAYVFALKPMPNSCLPAIFLKAIIGCKIILDIDDLDLAYYPTGLRQKLVHACFRFFPSHFDLITTHNEHLRSLIMNEIGIPPGKIYFLAQGIEAEQFIQSHHNHHHQRNWGIDPTDRVLVYSASLGITSDFVYVLPMLMDFLKNYSDIKVLVIGSGIRKPDFVRKVEAQGLQERIIFTGYIPHAHMPGVLKLGTVGINYMAPTKANQCRASIKVREYMAAGLNVVCNPVGDGEIFNDHVILCERIEEFPAAIRKALDVQDQNKAKEAQRFVERNYSWPRLVEDFLAHLMNSQK